ncbi:MAG: hypothetical protein PW845_04110 [Pseudomonas sp.]|nr:hypothetical protein [Pseudomonas sp. PIA16]MDE1164568.1 hypothetical protein [Pseudomonas sp.]
MNLGAEDTDEDVPEPWDEDEGTGCSEVPLNDLDEAADVGNTDSD